ncbi:MAG: hypothetical protein C4576_24560 [Desulfobacteraceae bacterium]|nr:MAG: hypothetical protein C4576_24560 [Desulfobacteraceae bacterium]
MPGEIFVFTSTGERVLIVYSPAETDVAEIRECKEEWERFSRRSAEALDVYRSSKLKDKKAIDDSFRYREQGFEAYRRCFGREATKQPFFLPLKRQVQSILDRLEE